MALELRCENPFNSMAQKAYFYIKILHFDRENKTGYLKLNIWENEKTKKTEKKLPFGELVINLAATKKINDDGIIQCLRFNDLYNKSDSQIYEEIKTLKVKFNDEILDFSKAKDI